MNEIQSKQLNDIHTALVGDDYRNGLIQEIEELKQERNKNRKFRWTFGTVIIAELTTLTTLITKSIF